jgi:iron complex transport system substrate-binding protein
MPSALIESISREDETARGAGERPGNARRVAGARPGNARRALAAAAILVLGIAVADAAPESGSPPPAAAVPAGGIVLRDDLAREVVLARPAQRIVSLLPSLTETICALGACGRLVATDRYSDWPSQVKALPKTGGLDDAEIEEIVRLKPDLVVLSRTQRITERLKELGVESFALDTQTYGAIAHVVTTLGEILGLPERANLLNRQIELAVNEIGTHALVRRHGTAPTVYAEVDGAPYAAGPESFIGKLLSMLGTRNIVTPELGPFPKLNPEYVVRHDPDVIMELHTDVPPLRERPGWSQIRAVRDLRVCSFAPAVIDTLTRPGPRIADGMRAMEDCLERVAP